MSRAWVWVQLAIAWLPIWLLFTAIIMIVHGSTLGGAAMASARMVVPGALLGVVVYKSLAPRPWPHPFRLGFIWLHVAGALLFSVVWYGLICVIDSLITGRLTLMIGPGLPVFMSTGIWLYLIVAAVAYANMAAQRTAQMEANAARMQLDALRTQLHPHFLFNALHAIVQLIPSDPRGATRAAEELGAALRALLGERRDLITLAEEWAFVERYLAIERIRFGDRLNVRAHLDEPAHSCLLPSFALQTLVENAVSHGAAPRIDSTAVTISASRVDAGLVIRVADDGAGADVGTIEHGPGTGLRRLRERLRWLYGDRARLDLIGAPGHGFAAELRVPQGIEDSSDLEHRP
jgi:two-component system, LytTR family, sensor kinase